MTTKKPPLTQEDREAERIGKLIRKHRKKKGWSQQNLSEQTNLYAGGEFMYRQLISLFECGDRLTKLCEIKAIAQALGSNYREWL